MNRLDQFLRYAQKVFGLKDILCQTRSRRPFPQIPISSVLLSILLGTRVRISSYHDLASQTQRRRWQHLCGLKDAISHDTFAYVMERVNLEDLRQNLWQVARTLKANKALESCKINGLLFVSLDANEHFKSRSRCCPACSQRRIQEKDEQGQIHTVTEYYHRSVVAQINGPDLNVVLDLEPIRPGEEECTAGLRLLGRLRRRYGVRFFDALTLDGWYAQGPFLRAVDKLGWAWVVVIKRQDMGVVQEGLCLSQNQPPAFAFKDEEPERQVRLWGVADLPFSDGYPGKVRVVRSQEEWVQRRIVGGRKQSQPRQSLWLWAVCLQLAPYDERVIYQAGHRRWGIENKAFNELTQAYHLEHCYHHEPHAMLAQMLMLMLGFLLFCAFAQLHSPWIRSGRLTLKALAKELDLALEADLPWNLWFHSG